MSGRTCFTLVAFTVSLAFCSLSLPGNATETPPPADQRWISDMLAENQACDPATARMLAGAARRGIEREVYRREDSIRPPSASAELSCLGELVRNPALDRFFPTQQVLSPSIPGFLQGILGQIFGEATGGVFGNLDLAALASGDAGDPTRALSSSLCSFAEQRWNQATLPVLGGFPEPGNLHRGFARLPSAGATGLLLELLSLPAQDRAPTPRASDDVPTRLFGPAQ